MQHCGAHVLLMGWTSFHGFESKVARHWTFGQMVAFILEIPILENRLHFVITAMIRFVGDGFNGVLGYCNRLYSVAVHKRLKGIETYK